MRLTVFGSGYVGLVTGACLADIGNQVLCVDIDPDKVDRLKQGKVPIYEPGLEEMIHRNLAVGRLNFTTNAEEGVQHGLFQLIAVGTPPGRDGAADISGVIAVAESIGRFMSEYRVVIVKSTVPVGTADKVRATVAATLASRQESVEFDVVSNPEFLKEGAAIRDFMSPYRIVVGSDDPRSAELLKILYDPFTRNHERMIIMNVRSAELTKYAANAMLATKISFMNELSNLAERAGADIEKVRLGIGSDPRIGYGFIYPGCGFGGSCFPKDVQALIRSADEHGLEARLLQAVQEVNSSQKKMLFRKIQRFFGDRLSECTIAVWGLAFKPNTDDVREAPSLALIDALYSAGAKVHAYDPVAGDEVRKITRDKKGLEVVHTAEAALQGADALAIVTEWKEFHSPDFDRIKELLIRPVIFDGRNLYDPDFVRRQGFQYFAVGRGERVQAEREATE